MWKNRVGYGLLVLGNAVLFYLFGLPVLGVTLVLTLLFGLGMGIGVLVDGKRMKISCRTLPGGVVGKSLEYHLQVESPYILWTVRELVLEVESTNTMTGVKQDFRFLLPMQGKTGEFLHVTIPQECGEHRIVCKSARVRDHLKLFSRRVTGFAPLRTVIYPQKMQVEVSLSRQSAGKLRDDGSVQNRLGMDNSEMFDIRDYTPGDDVRNIHWKLSVKTEKLVLRQPSAPEYYDLVVLPDFGMESGGEQTRVSERNGAIGYGAAVLEQLARRGLSCCLAVPKGAEIQLYPIRSQMDYEQAITAWMCTRLPKNSGDAAKSFFAQRLDGRFSRMLVLSTGRLDERQDARRAALTVTVLSAVEGIKNSGHAIQNGGVTYLELPAQPGRDSYRRVTC